MDSLLNGIRNIFVHPYPLVKIHSEIDGNSYNVRDMKDKQQAANLISKIRIKLVRLFEILRRKYPDKPQIKFMEKNFNPSPTRYIESTPDSSHTSYSINKGESVHLCLRQRSGNDESLVDENILVFVSLHELAHIMTSSIGHGQDFWNNFAWLLREAEQEGIYTHTNFKSHPVPYCGVTISDSPKYDSSQEGTDFQVGKIEEKS